MNHPDRDQRTAFGHGRLPEVQGEAIPDHVADCSSCQELLDDLADDTLLALIRPLFAPGHEKPPLPADGHSDARIGHPPASTLNRSHPMPYLAELSRTNPTCMVFLIDQSRSMAEPFGAQPEKPKAQGVADGINRLLQNLVLKCAKADGIRDYFHIGVVGYGV
jgi:hypothetical protein